MEYDDSRLACVGAYVEAMNRGDFEALRKLFTPDARIVGVNGAGGIDFAIPIWVALHEGLKMHLTIEDIVCDRNIVAVRYTERGRWVAPFLGFDNPTGRPFELIAMEWFEMHDGLIASRWGARDAASLARQAGFPNS